METNQITKPICVYVKINDNGDVVAVNSNIFQKDLTGWVKIDEGYGDKYAHAQSQYFEHSLINEDGDFAYNISDLSKIKW